MRTADNIVVMVNGRIEEEGTHEDLVLEVRSSVCCTSG